MKFTRTDAWWLAGYVCLAAAIVAVMLQVRQAMVAELSGPEARAEWERWKADATRQSGVAGPVEGPVQRRAPLSDEPPTLVMLRDHFGLLLTAALVFATVIYVFLAIVSRGLSRKSPTL